jgi:hypothetical protein
MCRSNFILINNYMRYKNDKTERIEFKIDKELKEKFEKYCEDNAYTLSARIRLLIERDIENGKDK